MRVGVVGLGRIGRMHAELLKSRVPGAVLAAVADTRAELASGVAASLGTESMDPRRLVSSPDVDVVAICSPTDTHVELIVEAAAAGKAVFCEKPVALDLAEVDRGLAAVRTAGVPFMVGFNRRFDPAHAAVRAAVARGEVGEPHLVRISSRDPAPPPASYVESSGGIFLDMTIHDFDMARFLTDSEVVEVFAQGAVRIDPRLSALGDLDTVTVLLVHKSGCLTAIDNSRRAVYGFDQRVEVFGSRGLAASSNPLTSTSTVLTSDGARLPRLPQFFLDRYLCSYIREWRAFVEAVTGGRECPVGAYDSRAALVIGMAASVSVQEHRPVRVVLGPGAEAEGDEALETSPDRR